MVTRLYSWAWEGYLEVVQWLLQNGALPGEKDNCGDTAFLWLPRIS